MINTVCITDIDLKDFKVKLYIQGHIQKTNWILSDQAIRIRNSIIKSIVPSIHIDITVYCIIILLLIG